MWRNSDEGDGGFRRYGHSKDHRPDLPQIIIGLVVTREGIPVRCWCWPGNTSDATVLPEVKDGPRGWRLGRVVTVVDRGFSSDANLAYLTRAGGHWIAGERMRDGSPDAAEALGRQGRYQSVRDNLRVKEVRLDSTPHKRWIVCHNPAEAERDKAQRDAAVARLEAELRIRAHVLLCWLALLLTRVAERRCDTTWRRIATELGRTHAVTLQGSAGTVTQTAPPSDTTLGYLSACGIDPPPRITHLDPA